MGSENRPLVVARLIGGLGNQMFQYAAARTLALRIEADVLLDVTGLDNRSSHHGFELPYVFDGEFPVATARDLRKTLGWLSPFRAYLTRRAYHYFPTRRVMIEPRFAYWAEIEKVATSCYLVGYWQSEKYFRGAEHAVRNDFTFKPANAANRELSEAIANSDAVSIHVRRGDYASNPVTRDFHGLCSPDYYGRAVEFILERVDSPSFYVFSDDLAWCRKNLRLPERSAFVDINRGPESYNDMRLMSLCKHHIIANSTFSWWGAWLSAFDQKQVVAPSRWFLADGQDTSTIYPETWTKL